jgi:hypothetical protein
MKFPKFSDSLVPTHGYAHELFHPWNPHDDAVEQGFGRVIPTKKKKTKLKMIYSLPRRLGKTTTLESPGLAGSRFWSIPWK